MSSNSSRRRRHRSDRVRLDRRRRREWLESFAHRPTPRTRGGLRSRGERRNLRSERIYCTWPLGIPTRSVSEGVKPLPRLHFGLIWDVSSLTGRSRARNLTPGRHELGRCPVISGWLGPGQTRNSSIWLSTFISRCIGTWAAVDPWAGHTLSSICRSWSSYPNWRRLPRWTVHCSG
jgi:hypothetical protein